MAIITFQNGKQVDIALPATVYEAAKAAELASKVKNNDYRSMDIGIVCAYLTAEAAVQGLGTCILGWFDDSAIRTRCGIPSRAICSKTAPTCA